MDDKKLKIIDDLNSRRLFLKMSQQDLADAAFMSKSTVSRALDPETGNPKIRDVVSMARAMDAELTIMTPETKLALENSDVTFYREAIIKAEAQIEDLTHQKEIHRRIIDERNSTIETLRNSLATERAWSKRLIRIFIGVISVFALFIVFLLAIDLLNQDSGWFRNVMEHIR